MKYFLFSILAFFLVGSLVAQVRVDTLPPYKKNKKLPSFSIQQTDSSWLSSAKLPKNKFTVIVYFSPDCGHCQIEAQEMVNGMDSLKKVSFVWIGYRPLQELKDFYYAYGFNKFPNIKIGRDANYSVASFYQLKQTPFVAVYDKIGQFLSAYEAGVMANNMGTLLKLFRKS